MNKKKILRCFSVLLALSMLMAMLPAGAYAADTVWDGTSVDTSWYNTTETSFTITTAAQLAGLAALVNKTNGVTTRVNFSGKTIILGADIDLNGKEWTSISNKAANHFAGVFDGGGHTIRGMVVNADNADNGNWGGLFGTVKGSTTKNAGVRNLTVKGSIIVRCTKNANTDVGGLCTQASYAEIENCVVDVVIFVTRSDASLKTKTGGIVGKASNYLHMSNCINLGNVNGCDYVGGLVGYTDLSSAQCYLTIDNCTNYGNISGENYVGGLVGQFASSPSTSSNQQSTLINSFNAGIISATGDYVGGLCAYIADKNNVKNCFSTGKIIVAEEATNAGLVFGESLNPGGNSSSVISEVYYLSDTNKNAIGSGVELNLTPMDSAEISSVDFVALLNSNAISLGASDDVFKAGLNHPIFVWQPDEVSDATLGDINKDGTVNASDVSDLIYALATGATLGFDVADINTDGTINASDVSELVLRILLNE